jgi:hypothetical protein
MNHTPIFELQSRTSCTFPVARSRRPVCISSHMLSSRLHGVRREDLCERWILYARDDSNSALQWPHLKQRDCGMDTLWLICLFIDRMLSDSSACHLNCVALGTFTLWKRFSKVKQERTQKRKTSYSHRARERDSFPDIAYSLSTGIDTD